MLVLLGVHHWFRHGDQSVYPIAVLFLATFAGYAAGGVAYPAALLRRAAPGAPSAHLS